MTTQIRADGHHKHKVAGTTAINHGATLRTTPYISGYFIAGYSLYQQSGHSTWSYSTSFGYCT